MRAVDVLPLVPVMWMAGYWSCGEPSSSISASIRERGAGAMRRGVRPDGTPASASNRSACASSQARARARLHHDALGRVGIGELDLDPELVSRLDVDVAGHPTGFAQVVERELERLGQLRAGCTPWRARPRCASIAARCSSPSGSR